MTSELKIWPDKYRSDKISQIEAKSVSGIMGGHAMLRRQWRKSESDPGNGSGGQQGSVVVGGGRWGVEWEQPLWSRRPPGFRDLAAAIFALTSDLIMVFSSENVHRRTSFMWRANLMRANMCRPLLTGDYWILMLWSCWFALLCFGPVGLVIGLVWFGLVWFGLVWFGTVGPHWCFGPVACRWSRWSLMLIGINQ